MPPINETTQLPKILKWYVFTKIVLALFLVSILLIAMPNWSNLFFSMLVFIGLPIWIYKVLSYKFTTFLLNDNSLTINSGILFKSSLTIPFKQVQNSTSSRGPLSNLFSISKLNIWTASVSQIQISKGNSNNRPDGQLWLSTDQAILIKGYILNRK